MGMSRCSVNANKRGKFPTAMRAAKDQNQWNFKAGNAQSWRGRRMAIIVKREAASIMRRGADFTRVAERKSPTVIFHGDDPQPINMAKLVLRCHGRFGPKTPPSPARGSARLQPFGYP
jgi:hypothetical protein